MLLKKKIMLLSNEMRKKKQKKIVRFLLQKIVEIPLGPEIDQKRS